MRRASAAIVVLCLASGSAWSACTPPSASGFPAGATRLDTQTKDAVSITGGCIDGVPVGQNTPAAGTFTNFSLSGGSITLTGNLVTGGALTTGGTVTTVGNFATGGTFSTDSTFSTVGAFSTGGAFSTAGPLATTGTGPTTFALPSATATYTYPAASAALMGITPASCDGYTATNGAITTGTPNFSSATANFVAGDVGKKISINKAGATQYFGFATIAAGGTGYARGDTIVLSGGTGTAATVVVRTVSGGAITAIAGDAGSLGSYTAVPGNNVTQASTSGSGTGATFTVTWLRDNLVTTIISRQSATQVTLAANASATASSALWGYGTDYATEINAAIATGVVTTLPKGICGVGATVSVGDSQILKGAGTGGYSTTPTEVMWLGAVDGTVLAMDNGGLVNGARAGPFNINGLGAVKYGARIRGLTHGAVDVQAEAAKDFGISLEESESGVYDVFFNDFRMVSVQNHGSARNAVGISFPRATISGGLHDVNGNNFYNTAIFHQDGIGIDLREGYMNAFYLTQIFGGTGAGYNGFGIRFGGSTTVGYYAARGNTFYELISQGTLLSEGGPIPGGVGGHGGLYNRILPLDLMAFVPAVVIEAGSALFCETSNGDANYCTPHGYDARSCGSPTGTATTANYVAMGCAGTITLTRSGKMRITINGAITNNTLAGGALATIWYGTGTAPVNGANIEAAGTTRVQCGGFPALVNTPSGTFVTPLTVECSAAPGSSNGTGGVNASSPIWYDLGLKAVAGGSAAAANVGVMAHELP